MGASLDVVRRLFEGITFKDSSQHNEEVLELQHVTTYRSSKNKDKCKKSILRKIGSNLPLQTQRSRRSRKFKNRSAVRVIASMLPMKPCKRAYFEMFKKTKTFVEDNVNTVRAHVPSLADIGFSWDDFDIVSHKTDDLVDCDEYSTIGLDNIDNTNCSDYLSSETNSNAGSQNASDKITVLEDELAKLRKQIALIVSMQEQKSKPVIPVPPPCPPPPPPPPVPYLTSETKPRTPRKQLSTNKERNTSTAIPATPSMSDILKGLGSIKLKSSDMKRSPGGTPLKTNKSKLPSADSQDPADIIANALRSKFSKVRYSIGSPTDDKENNFSPQRGFTPSPTSSPNYQESSDSVSPVKPSTSRRRSSLLSGKTIVLSPVEENL